MKLPITPSALPGTMEKAAKTGTWKSQKPILDPDKCNGCLICWLLCPDSAIAPAQAVIASGSEAIPHAQEIALRLDLCKGCGICAVECPVGALRMEGVK